jgi:hypothetical protein
MTVEDGNRPVGITIPIRAVEENRYCPTGFGVTSKFLTLAEVVEYRVQSDYNPENGQIFCLIFGQKICILSKNRTYEGRGSKWELQKLMGSWPLLVKVVP